MSQVIKRRGHIRNVVDERALIDLRQRKGSTTAIDLVSDQEPADDVIFPDETDTDD